MLYLRYCSADCCSLCCVGRIIYVFFFFFKQKTAYEMRISDWSSDVCSSDLTTLPSLARITPSSSTFQGPGEAAAPKAAFRLVRIIMPAPRRDRKSVV